MLAMGRALMSDPRYLLLDEPSLGLAPRLVEQIRDLIVEINKTGTGVLLVEQNATMALSIAEHGYVLETGKVVLDKPAAELLADEDIREFYLGLRAGGHGEVVPRRQALQAAEAVAVMTATESDRSTAHAAGQPLARHADPAVRGRAAAVRRRQGDRRGQLRRSAGSELFADHRAQRRRQDLDLQRDLRRVPAAVRRVGSDVLDRARTSTSSASARTGSPRSASPARSRTSSCSRNLTVLENLMLGRHHHIRYGPLSAIVWLGRARREEIANRAAVEDIVDFLELEQWRRLPVGLLPYGVQKRVELGRALAMEPKLLLLDEPVAGMNLEETEDMARYILDIRDELRHPDHPGRARHGPGHGPGRPGAGGRLRRADRHRHAGRGPAPPRRHPGLPRGGAREVTSSDQPTRGRRHRRTDAGAGGHDDRDAGSATGPPTHARTGSRMREKDLGIWQEVTWAGYWDTAQTVGARAAGAGHRAGRPGRDPLGEPPRVAVRRRRRPSRSARSPSACTRPTRRPRSATCCRTPAPGCSIAEDQEQVDKALAVLDDCPDLERIVYLEPRGIRYRYDHPKLMSWDDLLALGAEHRAAHPGAVDRADGRGQPRRHRDADLHLRHHRPAQGRHARRCPMWSSRSRRWSTAAGSPRRRRARAT